MEIPEVHASFCEVPNGLTVIVAELHSAPVASIQVWCQTGSIHEGEWLGAGLTHLLEHVLFNGTERRSSKQISDEIHSLGGYLNAYTSFDRTVFWVDCPANAVRQSIDLLGDMLFRSIVDPAMLEREMDVIRREFDMGLDDPDRVLSYLTFGRAFQVHQSHGAVQKPVAAQDRLPDRLRAFSGREIQTGSAGTSKRSYRQRLVRAQSRLRLLSLPE